MVNQRKLAGMLGIAAKAGRLVYGCNLVCDAVRSGTEYPNLVLIAADASGNTEKRVRNCCTYYGRPYMALPMSCHELSHATGRSGLISCVGVNDRGFSEAILHILSGEETKPSSDTAGGRRR